LDIQKAAFLTNERIWVTGFKQTGMFWIVTCIEINEKPPNPAYTAQEIIRTGETYLKSSKNPAVTFTVYPLCPLTLRALLLILTAVF
jgi:hypothetical protein